MLGILLLIVKLSIGIIVSVGSTMSEHREDLPIGDKSVVRSRQLRTDNVFRCGIYLGRKLIKKSAQAAATVNSNIFVHSGNRAQSTAEQCSSGVAHTVGKLIK